ncbi:MAG: hypothetical protein II705_06500, partial [Clostridia bacterium]|nr:hypothetical protein [Clostridia bacterium]
MAKAKKYLDVRYIVNEDKSFKYDVIDSYIKRFDEQEGSKEKAVAYVFNAKNDDSEAAILARVAILNLFYSAGLNTNPSSKGGKHAVDLEEMAKRIQKGLKDNRISFKDNCNRAAVVDA